MTSASPLAPMSTRRDARYPAPAAAARRRQTTAASAALLRPARAPPSFPQILLASLWIG
ncbi:hypothetical protein C7S16_4772 [Burkholderia thailandensis]|uniref:Uncharacterized protein n=1 Tax=Burkholderia thailandensis TaxID=57975 RepID=A0AAW9CNN4_BURTH|nr:hypothetical protein [Burkholderia thailandensis]